MDHIRCGAFARAQTSTVCMAYCNFHTNFQHRIPMEFMYPISETILSCESLLEINENDCNKLVHNFSLLYYHFCY